MAKKQKVNYKPNPIKTYAGKARVEKSTSHKSVWLSKEWIPVIIITIIAFAIRVYNIGFHSFWVDEYLHVLPAWDFIMGKGLNHIDGFNGIFTTWVHVIFMFLFGNSEFAARLPMALFSSLTIPILYLLVKKLSNREIALLTIVLFTVSLYMIFWGRVARNYATFLPFYLLLNYYFIKIFEPNNEWTNSKPVFKLFNVGILLITFVLSLLNHPLTIFFFFGLFFYGTVLWLIGLFKNAGPKKVLNKYTAFPIFLISFILLWHPGFVQFVQKILALFLPKNIVEFQTPDLNRLITLFNTKRFEAFDVYKGVIETDMLFLPFLGLIGFFFLIKKHLKYGLFITISFLYTLFLISFVFREAALSRYLFFIYPFLLIAIASTLWYSLKFLNLKLKNRFSYNFMLGTALVLILSVSNLNNVKAYLTRTEHGQLVDKKIAEWYFTNWKDPIHYVQLNLQKGDVILSTVQNSARFYMDIDTSKLGWFRQLRYDAIKKEYVQNEPTGKKVSGYTTEEFIATVQNHPRGWLLADYYFNNVMTDPQARNYAIQNLDFHFGASKDGSVQVFSWDHSKRKPFPSSLLIELGKPLGMQASQELEFNFRPTPGINQFNLYIILEGYDTDGEGFVNLNGRGWTPIPKPANSRGWGAEQTSVTFDASMFNEGPNKAQFTYNPEIGVADVRKGFVIYSVNVGR
jgi:4-amino-4-deoxy-L-arabinose transferase-like glycosyltransferase